MPRLNIPIGLSVPRRGNGLTRAFGRSVLRVMGWRIKGAIPDLPRFVVIVVPHTSNWDFVIAMATLFALGVKVSFIGKHTLFKGPFGAVMRWLGGIAVERTTQQGFVTKAIESFNQREQLILGLAPEGTRKKVDTWRSGFYHIARGADVPLLLAGFDYREKVVKVGPLFQPTGDMETDFVHLRTHFAGITGKKPHQA